MHVPGFKTGLCEGRGHFGLGIHALFTQHRNLRTHVTGMNVRSARMLFRIKGGFDKQPLMVGAAGDFQFAVGARRIVAAARDFAAACDFTSSRRSAGICTTAPISSLKSAAVAASTSLAPSIKPSSVTSRPTCEANIISESVAAKPPSLLS